MTRVWIDDAALKRQLIDFFQHNGRDLSTFGSRVNQTFEAFVFASVVKWYSKNEWDIEFKHPKPNQSTVKLKFSTRGRPENYTYVVCSKGNQKIQIRHQLRIATSHHEPDQNPPANVVLDVAVIKNSDLSDYSTDDFVDNCALITFGEAKHMSAFAELIAGFIGLVHEMRPCALRPKEHRTESQTKRDHLPPFLYVSGFLYRTGAGLVETIRRRDYNINVYDYKSGVALGTTLPTMPAPPKSP
jgi:hypothetical protein